MSFDDENSNKKKTDCGTTGTGQWGRTFFGTILLTIKYRYGDQMAHRYLTDWGRGSFCYKSDWVKLQQFMLCP